MAERPEFANWYKSFVDKVATQYKSYPVFMMLIGLPEKWDSLSKLQPSLMRIFRVIAIEKLEDEAVKFFFNKAFDKVNMKVHSDAMDWMVRYSSGLPVLMHEIGDAVFWADKDGIIEKNDAQDGIKIAAGRIESKYLDPKVYRAIRSERYRSILRKLAEFPLSQYFKKSNVDAKLNANEKKVFHNFLRRLRELGIIEPDMEKSKGSYRFVNAIYPVCIRMEAQRYKKSKE